MLILFHGSNVPILKIDLSIGQVNKDFGKGFYLTDIKDQADAMAFRRVAIDSENGKSPIVTTFEFDDSCLSNSELNVLCFESATAEWAEFIAKNRFASRNGFTHNYDIVYGPVADDGVYDQLRRYIRGSITAAQLAEELKFVHLNKQYYFGTKKAIQYLKMIDYGQATSKR